MMEGIREWLLGLIAAAIAMAVLQTVLPEGSVKKVAGITGGLVLVVMLLRGAGAVHLPELPDAYEEYASQIDRQLQSYQDRQRQQMEVLIAQAVRAYISDKAQALGLSAEARVEVRWDGETPELYRVTMDVPYHAALSEEIERELGVTQEKQCWQTAEGKTG